MTIVTPFSASACMNDDTQKPDGNWTLSSKMNKIITETEFNADPLVDLTSSSMSSHLLSECEFMRRQIRFLSSARPASGQTILDCN